jgi:methionine-S-sulfoxide reductase
VSAGRVVAAALAALLPLAEGGAQSPALAKATFAGGCFWCVEADFDKVDGVVSTTSGYIGGRTADPTYEQVSSGSTGHTEAVEVVFDPRRVSYEKLLEVFWINVDPTVSDRQFCDIGSQYRTGIFVHDETQRRAAEAVQGADRDADRAGDRLLSRRAVPPGLLPEEPGALPLLPQRLRPRRQAEGTVGR